MSTFEQQRRRIRTVGDLHSVVTTVKALAAASILHYERSGRSLASFFKTVESGLQVVLRDQEIDVLVPPQLKLTRPAVLVLGTDQGMCGPFNERLASFTSEYLSSFGFDGCDPASSRLLVAVGERLSDALAERHLLPQRVVAVPSSLSGVRGAVNEMLLQVEAWQQEGAFDSLLILYNEPYKASSYRSRCRQLLPLDRDWLARIQDRPWPSRRLPTYTMPWRPLFSALTRTYLLGAIQRGLVASLESENRSRLAAMQAAERNISELRDELEQDFRRQRQEDITRELIEVVSGYEVLAVPSRKRGRSENGDDGNQLGRR